jgi:NAD(P)H-hydrate epimerase
MIPVLTAQQIREADAFTMAHEPVASIDLMERAATACFRWLVSRFSVDSHFHIYVFCGNNGGDGLAIARMMHLSGYQVHVYEVKSDRSPSGDFAENKNRLLQTGFKNYSVAEDKAAFVYHPPNDVIIDALFGTGLSGVLKGLAADAVQHINHSKTTVVSIDIPSGLFADKSSVIKNHAIVKATHTLSFQVLKKAFLIKENSEFVGDVHLLPIGLDERFIHSLKTKDFIIEREDIRSLIRKRNSFSHKGDYGHAALIAGSFGKAGAAVLAAKACVTAGAGLTTVIVPRCAFSILQAAVPEAMCICPPQKSIVSEEYLHLPVEFNPEKYTVLGIGPGLGKHKETVALLKKILSQFRKPVVMDADALNILAENRAMLNLIPQNSVLTPHAGEFERLAGKARNDFHRLELLKKFASTHQCIMVLKGRFTCIATPEGTAYFNTTGNPSLAKGGSGDALTGMITGWLAQGYKPLQAAMIGVYLHGLAADNALKELSENSVTASDLIRYSASLLK